MTRSFAVVLAVVIFVMGIATGMAISTWRFCGVVLGELQR